MTVTQLKDMMARLEAQGFGGYTVRQYDADDEAMAETTGCEFGPDGIELCSDEL